MTGVADGYLTIIESMQSSKKIIFGWNRVEGCGGRSFLAESYKFDAQYAKYDHII